MFFCALRQNSLLDLITFFLMVLQRSHFAGVMCHFLGSQKTKWLPQGKAAPIVSHQQGFYSGRFPTTLRSSISSPFDDTSSFFQSITPACPGSAGSCLAVASSKLLGGRWQNGAPAVPLHLGRGSQGGKCLNLKFTTQVTGSLQLSCSNDVHCTVILMNKTTWTTSPFF